MAEELNFLNEDDDDLLDWDDEIDVDPEPFEVLPAGKADFEVISFERSNFGGSEKLKACKMAIVTIKASRDGKSSRIIERFYLCSKMAGNISAFFQSVGLKKHGEKTVMRWNEVVGLTGRCNIKIETYNGNQYNHVSSWIAKDK